MTGSTLARLPLEDDAQRGTGITTPGRNTYSTALTASRITRDVAISILSIPESPSARVGPTLRSNTGFPSLSACLTSLSDNVVSSWRDPRIKILLTGKLKTSRGSSRSEIACLIVLYHETCRAGEGCCWSGCSARTDDSRAFLDGLGYRFAKENDFWFLL